MKTFKLTLTAGLLAWGTVFLAPSSSSASIRISIAMPVQTFDFSDLDLRDENNQPISAPVVRQRFEDALNANLNRLLIENLTPLRRAWLALAESTADVFADWIRRALPVGSRLLATAAERSAKALVPAAERTVHSAQGASGRIGSHIENFIRLSFLLVSTTHLIR